MNIRRFEDPIMFTCVSEDDSRLHAIQLQFCVSTSQNHELYSKASPYFGTSSVIIVDGNLLHYIKSDECRSRNTLHYTH